MGEAAQSVTVRTEQGTLRGLRSDGVSSFKGIPYALPPFGERRFEAPVPVPPGEGELDCTAYGATVPKPGYLPPIDQLIPEVSVPGEDCLNLNVWTPDPEASGLPVLVWIHGGAFTNGSGAIGSYDGGRFAQDGVVAVTINYRLGVEGFGLFEGRPANRGLLDQVAALEWVRDNIARFGGDPARVTIAGESAGAMSVATLMAMPRAAGLFRGAVLQSGAGAQVLWPQVSTKVLAAVAEELGVEPTAEAFAAIDPATVIAAQAKVTVMIATNPDPDRWEELTLNSMPFEPTVDGDVLPGAPLDRVRDGAGADVTVLIGTNRDEMTLFLEPAGLPKVANEELVAGVAAIRGLTGERLAAYRPAEGGAWGPALVDVTTDYFFRLPAIRFAEHRAGGPTPTYFYEFTWPSPVWEGRLRSTHALEIGFAFGNVVGQSVSPMAGEDPPQKLADAMHSAWVAFATTLDPGWAPYSPDQRTVMTFDVTSDVVTDPRAERRAAWDGIR